MHMPKYYTFEVSLIGVEPKTFRTFSLPFDSTFFDLHNAIQVACGWQNYHGYMFQNENEEDLAKPYSSELNESNEDSTYDDIPDDVAVRLSSYFQDGSKHKKCVYIYDFQDQWLHEVTLLRVFETDVIFLRELQDGAGTFPPESCGGIRGYEELIAMKQTGKVPDSLDWSDAASIVELLEEWNPGDFDFNSVKFVFDLPVKGYQLSA